MLAGGYLRAWVLYPLAERWLGRQIRSKLRVLRETMALPPAERRRQAQRQLAEVLARAGLEVPYYRDLFRRVGFDPSKIAGDTGYLQELPFLTKDIIRHEKERLHSARPGRPALHLRRTGGSTGPAARIYYSGKGLDWTAAVNLLVREWSGKKVGHKELHLANRMPGDDSRKSRLREWFKELALHRVRLLSDRLDESGLAAMWRDLRAASPYLVHGHPSTMHALACYLAGKKEPARGVFRVFESTGEALFPNQREKIEGVFGCRVLNRYGSAEFGVVAYQRPDQPNRLQFLDPVAWPETDGDELVFTALLNSAMPLVRYRTGDLGKLIVDEGGVYLDELVGRIHDLVRIGPVTYPTHYVQDMLDRLPRVDEFQIEQRAGRPLLLRVVAAESARPRIAGQVRQWWGDDVEVEFTGFDGLKRAGGRAKFRHVVSPPAEAA